MNIKEIKELLDLMQEHQIASLEFEKGDVKLKLNKNVGSVVSMEAPRMMAMPSQQPSSAAPAAPAAAPAAASDPNVVAVKSPMVGTYYSSPAPDQPQYVKVGQSIKAGDVLCIVEAMKLMNEIKAEFSGTVVEILIENGQPIEYDQPIIKVKKS
ncbi:MAG TPA: acetyl-CoA carboxylase biotin carboxyl carrier protein [Candidatus Omnitrophota bacterium]|nr:acetyl-CoA carboxylase biotin carboxyl carrier protein [Candidatus Omnitrophota bacterium]HRK61669.1 acetyl-CoA carboxylase biotin carboxyl carrier protein [Candidatus Omnitrophota bacterium]